MFIDKSTIYFSNGKQFCGKTFVLSVLPRSLSKIEKSFSPKLPDYFILMVRKRNIRLSNDSVHDHNISLREEA